MRVLITGGAGYVGSLLVPRLLEIGYDVRVVDTLWFGDYLPKGCELYEGNICEFEDYWLDNVDYVIHLAAMSNDPMAEYNLLINYIFNGAGTALVAHKAKERGISKFVLASTCSVYGFAQDKVFDEEIDSIPKPQFPYAISKVLSERILFSLGDDRFVPIIFRMGTIGGYSPRMRYDLVVNAMTKSALTKGIITVSNPNLYRPLVDVRDVVTAYELALQKDVQGIFNIIERNYSIIKIAENVSSALVGLGKGRPELVVQDNVDLRSYKAGNDKARNVLEFSPANGIYSTVKSIVDKYDSGEISDTKNHMYYNVEVCKRKGKKMFYGTYS